MSYYTCCAEVFSASYLRRLRERILRCPYFSVNNLNRDFVSTKGFSIVFQRSHLNEVTQQFPYFQRYLEIALQPDCNAFYLNPLLLQAGSRVDPHIDRSLRAYCKTIEPPQVVTVLYIDVPAELEGGELILRDHRRQVAQVKPQINLLLSFQGNLTHSINVMKTQGSRLSLVCEQYSLEPKQLWEIPEFTIESRSAHGK